MRLTFITTRYPVLTQTFVSEPLGWLRETGVAVSLIANRPGDIDVPGVAWLRPRIVSSTSRISTIMSSLLAAPVASGAILRGGRRMRRSGIRTAGAVWRAMLPEVLAAEAIVAHFGPVGVRWLLPAALADRPMAVYFHGHDVGRVLAERPSSYDRLFRSGVGLLTNSDFQRDRLIAAGAPPASVAVVPLGVGPEFSVETEHTHPGSPRVVTIGRLVPKKGIDASVRAFARLRRSSGKEWEYHVVGDGPQRGEIEKLVADEGLAGVVHLRGFLPRRDTIALLRSASVFVLASRSADNGDTEGTPVSILEAASLGVPIVTTRHAGIPETLPPEAAREGFLVEEGDLEALACAVDRLAASSDLRCAWGDACRAHVRRRHSAEAFVSGLLDAVRAKAKVPAI